MDFLDRFAPDEFAGALGILDAHPETHLDHEMKTAAGETAHPGLRLVQHGAGQPARTDDAIRFLQVREQLDDGPGRRGAIGIHVADHIRERGELEPLDERAALADGRGEILEADAGVLEAGAPHDVQRVVTAAVENHDNLKAPGVVLLEILRVAAQHRSDARFFVISRDEEQQAWFGHASA